jgi:Zn-dependent protease with chaperone function
LEGGEIYDYVADPKDLAKRLEQASQTKTTGHLCPRCRQELEESSALGPKMPAEACPACGGLWLESGTVDQFLGSGANKLGMGRAEPEPENDPQAHEKARDRLRDMAAGVLALPNLFLRSALTLTVLYGFVALVLITLVQFTRLGPGLALGIGVAFAVLQFTFGPWIMDLSLRWLYKFRWVEADELPEHLRDFVARVTSEHKMRFPSFGLIDDGAPAAFTYGHHPNNARVVISRGILELLEPAEVEAVVAHELGHARNWDMALMTMANLVPLLLYYLYRVAIDFKIGKDDKDYSWIVAVGAYVLYIISEYLVLWFSRTREYYADRFSGQVTRNPNALASALVKIAYGLAAQGPPADQAEEEEGQKKKKKAKKQAATAMAIDGLGALNIFDRKGAVGLVMGSAPSTEAKAGKLDIEQVKGAMQWDLWNPWAKYYELHSTHPLVAKRLMYLTDLAAHQDQEPLVIFDRRQPESYWDDFAADVFMMMLPLLGFLAGAGLFLGLGFGLGQWQPAWLVAGVALGGLGSLAKTLFSYRRGFFPHLTVAALLHKVKVSEVRPVPATLTGTIIGKGVPGLVWSEDFVMRDRTGILFLNYRQPLGLWNWLFGLLKAGAYQGKEIRVSGWYRRAPVPFLEINRIEVLDGSLPSRGCYTYHAKLGFALFGIILGIAGTVALLMM